MVGAAAPVRVRVKISVLRVGFLISTSQNPVLREALESRPRAKEADHICPYRDRDPPAGGEHARRAHARQRERRTRDGRIRSPHGCCAARAGRKQPRGRHRPIRSEEESGGGGVPGRRAGDRARRLAPQLMEVWLFQYYALGWTMKYIAEVNQTSDNVICYRTVREAIKRYEETGTVDYPPHCSYRKKVGPDEEMILKQIVEDEPYLYLGEIAALFNESTGMDLSR